MLKHTYETVRPKISPTPTGMEKKKDCTVVKARNKLTKQ